MYRQVLVVALSNGVALVVMVIAYLAYSRLLGAEDFALLFGGIALAKFCTLVLDGGIKTAFVKHPGDVAPEACKALYLGSLATAGGVLMLMAVILGTLWAMSVLDGSSALFLACYATAYIVTYPFMLLQLAQLERDKMFTPVATWEAISLSIEYLAPLLLWLSGWRSFAAFVVAACLSRGVRMLGMRTASDIRMRTGMHVDWAGARLLFSEGWKFQVATAISMVRDNLHYLLVAPVFGVGWAGYYSWALQLATVSSQVFVQTASRVALPFLRGEGHAGEKWDTALVQVKWLAIFTLPLVAFIYHIADATNRLLFAEKWTVALPLVLAFSARMVPGIVTTALSYFVLAQRGSASFAKCNFWWTCAEVGAGVILLAAVGPTGLAWSYSVMAWVGVLLFLREARQGGMRIVLATLLCRKSLIAGMVASIAVYYLGRDVHGMVELVLCAVLIVVAILAEPQVRTLGRSWWVSRR